MRSQPSRRKRGVVLTLQGWQRLQRAQRQWEIQENTGNSYTLEELSELSGLSPNTIAKVQHRQVAVDRQTLESYFRAFNLTLSLDDYTNPDSDNLESGSRVMLKGQVPLDSPFYVERPPI
ncbi:MAG TPA: hypothetical protein VIQ31_19350, partial [Phormidium sp.]